MIFTGKNMNYLEKCTFAGVRHGLLDTEWTELHSGRIISTSTRMRTVPFTWAPAWFSQLCSTPCCVCSRGSSSRPRVWRSRPWLAESRDCCPIPAARGWCPSANGWSRPTRHSPAEIETKPREKSAKFELALIESPLTSKKVSFERLFPNAYLQHRLIRVIA